MVIYRPVFLPRGAAKQDEHGPGLDGEWAPLDEEWALFAGDPSKFVEQVEGWPKDVRDYAKRLAKGAWRNKFE